MEAEAGWQASQTVLVLQGGGALGAYQGGVFQALHEHGFEPDWVIGTSIGAINGALIAGNPVQTRLDRVQAFWDRVACRWSGQAFGVLPWLSTVVQGVPGFFQPNPMAYFGPHTRVGVGAAFYTVEPLRSTLGELIDFRVINAGHPRLTVGAVNVRTGEMRYFDSREMTLGIEHVLASGALPPVFPAVRVGDDLYWDGGIYSNTPVEAVLDDRPRRDSLIFTVNVWQPSGSAPESIVEVLERQKDIQFASRVDSHIARQEQIHRLRHIIRQLEERLPGTLRSDPEVREMTAYGCSTTMHLVEFLAPCLDRDDHNKGVDFSLDSIQCRWRAGYEDACRIVATKPWEAPTDPLQGVVVHKAAPVEASRH